MRSGRAAVKHFRTSNHVIACSDMLSEIRQHMRQNGLSCISKWAFLDRYETSFESEA